MVRKLAGKGGSPQEERTRPAENGGAGGGVFGSGAVPLPSIKIRGLLRTRALGMCWSGS